MIYSVIFSVFRYGLLLFFVSSFPAASQQLNIQHKSQLSHQLSNSIQITNHKINYSDKETVAVELSAQEKTWMDNHPQISVGGGPDWAPFDFVAKNGSYQGFANDYLNLIAQKTGLIFNVTIDQWSHHLQNIQVKKIDLLGAAYYTKERGEYLNYSTPYIDVLDYFFIRDDLNVKTLKDLNGKRVAVAKDYAHADLLRKYFPKINIITVDTFGAAIDAVLENRADMLYDNYAALSYVFKREGINTIIPFKSTRDIGNNPIHIVSRKGAPELASIIQKGLDAISLHEKQAIYNKWLGKRVEGVDQNINLNTVERQWLKKHPTIRFGIDPNWPPYEFIDQSGQFKGISADIIKLLEQRLGILFVLESYESWEKSLEKARTHDVDVLSSITKTSDRENYLHFSKPYFTPLIGIYTRKDSTNISSLEDLNHKIVVIENKYFLHERLAKEYPDIKLLPVETTGEALKKLSYGQADAYVGNQGAANWVAENNALNNLKIIPETNLGETPLSMAVRNDWLVFQAVLNKALLSISDLEMATIRRKWLGVNSRVNKLILNAGEQRWLDEHKIIRFTGDPNWLPYEAFDQKGQYIGIVAEHLKLIEQQLGIKVEIIPTQSWSDSVAKVKRGEIDVLSETSDSDLKSLLIFTQPYVSSPVVIVMKNDEDYVENIEQIKHRKIAVIKEYGYVPSIKKKYPDLTLHTVANIQSGLTSVLTGKVDALLATLAQASYHISTLGINNIRIVGKTEFNTQLSFGMREEFVPLVALFNRALNTISQSNKQQIFDAWGKQQFTEKIDYKLLTKIAAILLFIIAIIIYWNRKLAKEIALRKEIEAQTQALIDTIPLQIVVSSFDGTILSANPKALTDYKIHKDEIDHYTMSDFYQNSNDRDVIIKELAETGKVEQKIIQFRKLNGALRSMMVSVMPILYHKQDALLTIAVDMTDRLEMESALVAAKKDADAANRAKSEFLANMSHEIRTPMNAIIGFTELLREQVEEPKLKTFVKTIQSAGNNLLDLINDILDLSKIEAGKLRIEKTVCNPHDLLTELGNIFKMEIGKKNIDFIFDIDPDIPKSLQLDDTRLKQVLFNLIGNAVKFTDQGFIRVKAFATNEDKIRSKLDLLIAVEDTGIGISKDQQQLVFQAFEQSHGQNVKQYGGTGLGLSISKRLVAMMGGEITLNSQLDKGSIFTIKLTDVDVAPLLVENNHEAFRLVKSISFLPSKILIVDDVEDNRQLLLANFADTQLKVEVAHNGLEAVDIVVAKQQVFDLILMDLLMPLMDGYQAAKEIKSYSNIPIIALTASVMTDEFDKIKSNDFQGYLRKPILKKDLMIELSRFLPIRGIIEGGVIDNQNEIPLLSSEDLKYLPALLIQLKTLLPQCREISASNNISEIQRFANAVLNITKQYPVVSVIEFAKALNAYIDCFDVASIKHLLNEYPQLITRLEKQVS